MRGTLRLRSGSAPTLRDGGGRRATPEADWLIGAELLTAKVRGVALRSMKALGTAYDDPVLGKDPQPAHMDDFVRTNQDNGGVHINSGIPNRAVYLAATAIGGNYKVSGPCRSMGNARPSWRRVQHCPYRIKTFRLS